MARFTGFLRGLCQSPSHEVRTVAALTARYVRTVTGRNVRTVEDAAGMDSWTASPSMVRKSLSERETVTVPPGDTWRVPYLAKLLETRQQLYYMGKEDELELCQKIIESLCI